MYNLRHSPDHMHREAADVGEGFSPTRDFDTLSK